MTYYSWWTASRLGRSSRCKHTHKTIPRIRGIVLCVCLQVYERVYWKNVSNTPAHIYFQNPPPTPPLPALHITKMRGGGGAGGGGGCVCVCVGGWITGLQRQLQLIRNVRGLSQECRQGNHTIYGNRGRTNFYQWAERAWEWLNMQRLISHPWRCMACVS